nr:MAG: hypothetical protein 1 [Barnaviridae sp.]
MSLPSKTLGAFALDLLCVGLVVCGCFAAYILLGLVMWFGALVMLCIQVPFGYGNSLVKRVYLNRKARRALKRSLRTTPESAFNEAEGELGVDAQGWYVNVVQSTQVLRVRIDDSAVLKLLFAKANQQGPQRPESRVLNSEAVRSPLPKSVVWFQVGTTTIGYGTRVKMGNKDYLLTARHVLQDLKRVSEPLICANGQCLPVDHSWPLAGAYDKLDIALVAVPSDVWSLLKVSIAKPGRILPGEAVKIYARDNGENVYHTGVMAETQNFKVKHTASTTQGHSGAAIWSSFGTVVGVHTHGGADGKTNYGVALEAFPLTLQESSTRERAYRESEFEDEECEQYDGHFGTKALTLRVRSRKYAMEMDEYAEHARSYQSQGVSWADAEDLDMDDYLPSWDDDFGRTETKPVQRKKNRSKAKKTPESGFQQASEGLSPPPEAATNGSIPTATQAGQAAKEGSSSSAGPNSAPAPTAPSTTRSPKKRSRSTRQSQTTGGPRAPWMRSAKASESTSAATSKATVPQSGLSTTPLLASCGQENTLALVFLSGVLPVDMRRAINASYELQGSKYRVGKKRMYITCAEYSYLVEANLVNADNLETVLWRVRLASNMQPQLPCAKFLETARRAFRGAL